MPDNPDDASKTPESGVVPEPTEVKEPPKEKESSLTLEQALAELKTVREEAARHRTEKQKARTEAEELQAKIKEFKDSQLSEEDRLKQELDELRTKNTTLFSSAKEMELKFQLALAAANPENQIADVKAAIKLMDRNTLEFDSAGNITNLQDALETLKTEYPSIVASPAKPNLPNTGTTNPGKSPGETRYSQADLSKLSPAKINELYAAGKLNHLL